jgi:hypothetical protein
MKISDTRIEEAGVFRCCVGSVATEYLNKDVDISGSSSECKHCGRAFHLNALGVWVPSEQ